MQKTTILIYALLTLASIAFSLHYYIDYKKVVHKANTREKINQTNPLDKYKVAEGVYYLSDNLDEYNENKYGYYQCGELEYCKEEYYQCGNCECEYYLDEIR